MGFFEVRQFTFLTEIYIRPTMVAMATKIWKFDEKMAKTRLIQEIEPQMLHQTGVLEARQFTGVI